jgi:hypothetical protein
LNQSSEKEVNSLVKDRKIQDGVDKRTYRVCFDKIHETLPGFIAKWTVNEGIKKLINDLERLGLSKEKFKQRDFYRLQQVEFLHEMGFIDDELYFN